MEPGYRFCPTEEELIVDYLLPKVRDEEVPGGRDGPVSDKDLYGAKPWDIWMEFESRRRNDLKKKNDLYFFSPVQSKSLSRKSRTVLGSDTWKGEATGEILFRCGTIIGIKKKFSYVGDCKDKGRWIMHEYDIEQRPDNKPKKEGTKIVLCLLRKYDLEPEKKRKHVNRKQEKNNEIKFGDKMDVCGDNEDNTRDLESKQPVLLEAQEKWQCILPSNTNHGLPSIQHSNFEEIGANLEKHLLNRIGYNNLLPQCLVPGISNFVPPFVAQIQGTSETEQTGGVSSNVANYGSMINNGYNIMRHTESMPAYESPVYGEIHQTPLCYVPEINNVVPPYSEQMQGTSEQAGVNCNVVNGSMMINNTNMTPRPASMPTYSSPMIDQDNFAGSSSYLNGGYTQWVQSFANDLSGMNCCPKFK